MAISVTATSGQDAIPGILLSVYVLTGASIPATPNTIAWCAAATSNTTLTIAQSGAGFFAAYSNVAPGASGGTLSYGVHSTRDVDNTVTDSVQGWGFASERDSSTVANRPAAGTVVTFWPGGVPGGGGSGYGSVAAVEVDNASGSTWAIDGSSPAAVSSTGNFATSTVTTAAFTPPAGSLIIACVAAPGSTPASTVQVNVLDSYGLAWNQTGTANVAGFGYASVWWASVPLTPTTPTGQPIAAGTVSQPIAAQMVGINGYPPYSFTNFSGLAPGLTADNTGLISGTPTSAGSYSYAATVTDAQNNVVASNPLLHVINASQAPPAVTGTWHNKGPNYSYGTTTVSVGQAEHDWLFAVVTWTGAQDQAVSYLADDAHNLWRPLSFKAPGGGAPGMQVWCAANTRPSTRVYVSTSAYVRNLAATVLAVRGLRPGVVVDHVAITNGTGGSTFGGSFTAGAADFALAAGASSAALHTMNSGWSTSVYATPGDSQVPGTSINVGWRAASSGSNVTATFTPQQSTVAHGSPPAVKWTYALIGIQTQPTVTLAGSNPAWPTFSVQAAWGYTPGDPTGVISWTTLTANQFMAFEGQRGRSFELDELSAADMTLTLDNSNGWLTPGNSASPYNPNVTLITPVQIQATWQGRTYCVFTGVITAIAEDWDFQRSVIKLTLADDFSKLPQVLLPSCMVAEYLYDDPVNLWPLNDAAGAKFASNWSGRGDSTLIPAPFKFGPGTQFTGFGNQNGNGAYPNGIAGTTDTNWGNNSGVGVPYAIGTCLLDRNDNSLPTAATGGATYEIWAQIYNYAANLDLGATLIAAADEHGRHVADHFKLIAINYGSVASPRTRIYMTHGDVAHASVHAHAVPNVFDGAWHHYAVTINSSRVVRLFLDGVFQGSHYASFPAGKPNRLVFGGDGTVPGVTAPGTLTIGKVLGHGGYPVSPGMVPGFFTGYMSLAAVFDRELDEERIAMHFQAGRTGFVNEYSGSRIQHVLSWARWAGPQAIESGLDRQQQFNYLGQGYASSALSGAIGQTGTAGGAAWVDNGAQTDITIQDIAASEDGMILVGADGTLTFRQRDSLYSTPVLWALGDDDYPLNKTQTFAGGLGGWTAITSGCVLGTSTAWTYMGGASAALSVGGTPATASARSEMVTLHGGLIPSASMWAWTPQGGTVQLTIDWYGSSGYLGSSHGPNTYAGPWTPVLLQMGHFTAPSGATSCRFGPDLTGSPAAGTQLNFDCARLSPSGWAVPYNDDVATSTDIQYLYNDIIITRNFDQATYRARDLASRAQYYPRVYSRTVYTSVNDAEGVVDAANWLLEAYKNPNLRVTQVTIDAASHPEAWPMLLGADIGDNVTFARNPVQGAVINDEFTLISVEPNIAPGEATVTYVLAPLVGDTMLTLDDSTGTLTAGALGW